MIENNVTALGLTQGFTGTLQLIVVLDLPEILLSICRRRSQRFQSAELPDTNLCNNNCGTSKEQDKIEHGMRKL
jgi:hypothetical protein